MLTSWFTSKDSIHLDGELSPPKLPLLPMPPLPDDFVYVEGLPSLQYGMPPLPSKNDDNLSDVPTNDFYANTVFGVGKITKFREDDMVEMDLLWTLGDNKPVKLIVHKTEIDHMSDSNELLDGEITPLSDSESDSLEYSDSDSDSDIYSSLETRLFPISKCTEIFSEVNLYILGGLYVSTFYLVSISLLEQMLC